jgi:hypothetical protein
VDTTKHLAIETSVVDWRRISTLGRGRRWRPGRLTRKDVCRPHAYDGDMRVSERAHSATYAWSFGGKSSQRHRPASQAKY